MAARVRTRTPRAPGRRHGGLYLPPLTGAQLDRLLAGSRPLLGHRHLAILEAVGRHGSLNAAAHHLGVSYRNAWATLDQLQARLGVSLVSAQTGGRHGGGSRLTPAGEDFVRRLRAFLTEHRAVAAQAASRHFGPLEGGAPSPPARGVGRAETMRLATTTSLVDSGLLGVLLPPFSARTGIAVELLPFGSGGALRRVRAGQADAILAHAPAIEERAAAAGDIVQRHAVMTNRFVLLGPADDPARVRGTTTPAAALRRIAAVRALFLSRADRSGTHECERRLLREAAVRPGAWHRPGRCGMAELLRRASAARTYVLSDSGTFAALADTLALEILADGGDLTNCYSIAAANPHRHRDVRFVEAMALIGWLTSPAAQEMIDAFRVRDRRIAAPACGTGVVAPA
jgi:tungstate transport system substrate-binding protein